MKIPVPTILCIPLLCTALLAGPAKAQPQQQPAPDMQDLMKAMGQVMSGGSNAAVVVDFRELKALLPATLDGMKRKNASGEKTGVMGMAVAYAEASYASETGTTVEIKITDMAGTGALGGLSRAGWSSMDIDRESDTGYERTTTIGGNKAYEKYDTSSHSGELQVMVKDRFLIDINGSGVSADRLKEALGKIDMEKLAELKPAEAPAPAPEKPAK